MKSNINATTVADRWRRQTDLDLGAPHRLAWYRSGPEGAPPWLLLHGGPGSGAHPGLRAALAPEQAAVAPDQRGSGRSRPRGSLVRNHTAALVSDLERLREHLGVARWPVLAGSWGTVLALAYVQAHPQRVERLVLRGAFALSRREIGGLLRAGRPGQPVGSAGSFWPARAACPWPVWLTRLRQLLQSGTPAVAALRAARHWAALESRAAARGMWRSLLAAGGRDAPLRAAWAAQRRAGRRLAGGWARRGARADRSDQALLRKFRIQSHYLARRGFLRPGALDRAVRTAAAAGVRVDWVHGRFDALCPCDNSRRWFKMGERLAPGRSRLILTRAGHLGHEPQTLAALRRCVGSA